MFFVIKFLFSFYFKKACEVFSFTDGELIKMVYLKKMNLSLGNNLCNE